MVCACVGAIMHLLTLVHYRYVHVHNHGISKIEYRICDIILALLCENVSLARHKLACAGSVYVLKGFYRINQITNSFLPLVQCFEKYTMVWCPFTL